MDFVEVCHIGDFIASHSESADSVTIHSIILLGLPASVYNPLICIECTVLTAKWMRTLDYAFMKYVVNDNYLLHLTLALFNNIKIMV